MGAESTGDNFESEADWCQKALSKVLDITAKKLRICARSKRWWNGEIKERRSQLRSEHRRRCRSAATVPSQAELQKSIWRAKDRMWNDYQKTLRGAEVRRAAKFANPRAGAALDALTDSDGNLANTITEKEEMLRRECFPLNERDQCFEIPPVGQAHQSVTEQSVVRALFVQAVGKAPRLDKLSFAAVHLLWQCEKKRIVELVREVLRTGPHPVVWKRANRIVIRKPGKDDYMKLKGYCSVSLPSCMGKVVEKVVAELMAEEA